MERISGMRSEDVLGKSAFELFPFLKENGGDKCFYRALAGESSISDNTPYTVPETGRHGFYKGYYSPFRDEHNEIIGGIAVVHDITEHKRAEEEAQEAHQRLTFHVENSPLAVIEWDSEARVSRWSESAERLFGWNAEEVLGKHVSDWHFVFHEDVDAVAQVTHRHRAGAELPGVQRNRNYTRDGSILYCEWYNSVLRDDAGRMVSVLSLVLDVSARKLAEEERAALLVRERDLRQRAEDADRLKDEFLATLSHELRTPLTSILGWASLITRGDIDESNVPNAMEVIERNARSQARLIDDLLDVSRIITGKLQLDVHPVNMEPLVEAANEALRPAAAAKGILVETQVESGSCFVSGDPNRLRQVIWNLVMNAIKFTPRGGKVSVRLNCFSLPPTSAAGSELSVNLAAQESGVPDRVARMGSSSLRENASAARETSSGAHDSYVRLTVSDNGEGIKPEFLPYVFHRFRQEESSITRKAGGLGLGLAVVRHLVELHGGKVSADSPGPGRGSTFIVELPLASLATDLATDLAIDLATDFARRDETEAPDSVVANETKTDVGGLSNRGQLEGIRVLLVEDDEDTRVLLRVMLKRRGAEVITTSSSAEALQWFTEQKVSTGQDEVRTGSGPGSPRGQPAWGGGSDRVTETSASPALIAEPTRLDIIISDLGMPEEDGYEFMRKVRLLSPYLASQSSPGIPAIALTGYATSKDRERALSVGYQFHLAKPVEPNELVESILMLLRP